MEENKTLEKLLAIAASKVADKKKPMFL